MLPSPLLLLLTELPEGARIPLAMLIVFGTAKVFAELFERIGQPGLVGEILAGVLIGPSVLNWIQPSAFLTALADLGAMFLLFRVGLEVKASELLKVGGTAMLVATLGVIVPQFLGWAIMRAWGAPQIEAIFVGAAMVATSVGITAQVLSAKGLLHHKAAQIILAAAVIDDVLGLLVLAVVSSMAKGQVNLLAILFTTVMAAGFTLLVAVLGTRAMNHVLPRVTQTLRAGEVQFNFAMILLFGLALMAVFTGVAAIIGAFLAGMATGEGVNQRVRDLAHGVTELLVPFFLAGIGLHLDVRAFTSLPVILLALVILAAAVVSKLIGCGLGAWSLGKADMLRVGFGMVPRGEVGMVVAQLGLAMGVIAANVYGVVVFMAVATTLVAPLLLNIAFKGVGPLEPPAQDFHLG
ncbi:MAG: cation:proton antiporter [Bryobacteraceae bacterium]